MPTLGLVFHIKVKNDHHLLHPDSIVRMDSTATLTLVVNYVFKQAS